MITVNSVSGGKTSAFMEVHYPADYAVFALVRIEDKNCQPKDTGLIRAVEDKIGMEFIATAEEDNTLRAVLDLEQFTGRQIHWVTGPTFDSITSSYLPNRMMRYCTVRMKLVPIRNWAVAMGITPHEQRIGFRANEDVRAAKTMDGLRDGWEYFRRKKYRTFRFPLLEAGILKPEIEAFWRGKPVTFADRNNCVGCFWRNPLLLKEMAGRHPDKFAWFAERERLTGKTFRQDGSYDSIKNYGKQVRIPFAELLADDECNSGYCGV